MAKLIPKIRIDDIGVKPERDVARALYDQLPSDCLVYHSYPWLREERNDRNGNVTLKEGEADFVIVMPNLGFLVLEVKGGPIEYESSARQWQRQLPSGGVRIIKDPFEQARRNTHFLKDQIVRHSFPYEKSLPCSFGYAVIFPDCDYKGPLPPGAETAIILSANDLQYLHRRIPETLQKWCRSKTPRPLSKKELDGIITGVSPSFQLMPLLSRKIEEQEERLVRITDEQLRVLDFLRNHQRAAIEGVAGSGKTLLAMRQAQRFTDQGMKTLLVCFNRSLADWLSSNIPEQYGELITITNFHRLCRKCCMDARLPFNVPDTASNDFWRYDAPEQMMNALEAYDLRYDAIVVDEGQDFFPEWWIALGQIQKNDDGPFYLFYDPAQNLYVGNDFSIPGLETAFPLGTNCRNTHEIAETCSKVRKIEIPVRDDAPHGDKTTVKVAETKDKQIQFCREIVSNWLNTGKLHHAQIAILSPNVRKKSSLADVSKFGNTHLTDDLSQWQSNKGVLFSTIRNFKGLEADACIIIDVPTPDSIPHFSQADFYVATSRAKHLLVLLPTVNGII